MTEEKKKKYTSIPVSPETAEKLRMLGHKGETYDQIINRLINALVQKPANAVA
ncbi:MAG: hypothetical protein QW222_07285 [Candidatus Bathyarchaeia archaeon]